MSVSVSVSVSVRVCVCVCVHGQGVCVERRRLGSRRMDSRGEGSSRITNGTLLGMVRAHHVQGYLAPHNAPPPRTLQCRSTQLILNSAHMGPYSTRVTRY